MESVAKFEKVSLKEYTGTKKSSEDANAWVHLKLPERATKGSAGYDFFSQRDIVINPHESVVISTGIKCKLADGYVLMMYPRSGLGFKFGLREANTVGIIDSDYYGNSDNEGHIKVKLVNPSDKKITIFKNKAFAQGIITKFYLAEGDNVTATRSGGFGSTDKGE